MTTTRDLLLFLGEAQDGAQAKTAVGLARFRPERCLAEHALEGAGFSLGLSDMTPEEAAAQGAKTLVIGTVAPGGRLDENWLDVLERASDSGLDLASGMHQRLGSESRLVRAAERNGTRLIDVREPATDLPIGNGAPRAGHRILTVGTDCNVGKMFTALVLEGEMRKRGYDATFKATGQTGILIAGEGVPLDAVPSDFLSGAIEQLSPEAPGEWHVIEGQATVLHPSFGGVTLGLIHGAQPDWLVVCGDPTRETMRHSAGFPVPSLRATLEASLAAARTTNPDVALLGCSLNTSKLTEAEARRALDLAAEELDAPAVDPVRTGVGPLVDSLPAPDDSPHA